VALKASRLSSRTDGGQGPLGDRLISAARLAVTHGNAQHLVIAEGTMPIAATTAWGR
jgi:hypothetical protein